MLGISISPLTAWMLLLSYHPSSPSPLFLHWWEIFLWSCGTGPKNIRSQRVSWYLAVGIGHYEIKTTRWKINSSSMFVCIILQVCARLIHVLIQFYLPFFLLRYGSWICEFILYHHNFVTNPIYNTIYSLYHCCMCEKNISWNIYCKK